MEQIRRLCQVPSISCGVIHEGQVIFDGGIGFGKNDSKDETPDPKSLYTLSSLSKTFVTAAFGILVHEQRIAWDDPVNKHLPEFVPKDPDVANATFNEVLHHSSGLDNPVVNLVGPYGKVIAAQKDFVHVLNDTPTSRDGNSFHDQWVYSNVAHGLVTLVIEKVSHMSFAQFVQTKILDPLGMKHTAVTESRVAEIANVAQSYVQLDSGKWEKIDHEWTRGDNAPILGMIGIRSSIKDMLIFVSAIMDSYSKSASNKSKARLKADTWSTNLFELLADVEENPLKELGAIIDGSYWWKPCDDEFNHTYRHHLP